VDFEFCIVSVPVPSTLTCSRVAAIEKPQLRLWETVSESYVILRLAVGQSFVVCSCTWAVVWYFNGQLISHVGLPPRLSVYHGDRRLKTRHGETFEYVKSRLRLCRFKPYWKDDKSYRTTITKGVRAPYALVRWRNTCGLLCPSHAWVQLFCTGNVPTTTGDN
jgi:hypothetical protein